MKASFKQSWYEKNGKHQLKCLVYEYRGYEYEVYVGDTQDTLCEQHKKAQAIIDRNIEIEERAKNHEPTETAAEAFAYFWELVN